MLNNTSKKFLLGFFGILLLTLAVWSWGAYFNPEVREKRALIKYFEDIEEEYRNDMYGGVTPEETLQMFIAALETGDIELASKYFLPDEREKIAADLKKEFEIDNNFDHLISVIGRLEQDGGIKNDSAFFSTTNEENIVTSEIILKKNQNNIWKKTEL